jgi:hypothetical protein
MGMDRQPENVPHAGIPVEFLVNPGVLVATGIESFDTIKAEFAKDQVPHQSGLNLVQLKSAGIARKLWMWNGNAGLATATATGVPAPTVSATAASADDANSQWIQHTTAASNPSHSGLIPSSDVLLRPGWLPDMECLIRTGATITPSTRFIVGITSATTDGATVPTTLHGAYFRYNAGTANWETAACAGAAPGTGDSGVAVAANTSYKMRIQFRGVVGSSLSSIRFFINDVQVADHTTSLPAANQTMSPRIRVTTTTAAARVLLWSYLAVAHS